MNSLDSTNTEPPLTLNEKLRILRGVAVVKQQLGIKMDPAQISVEESIAGFDDVDKYIGPDKGSE